MFKLLAVLRPLFCVFVLAAAAGQAIGAESSPPAGPAYFHKYFSGKIGGKYAVTMELKCQDGVLTGNYRYAGKVVPLYLKGKIGVDGVFSMEESGGYPAKSTGVFNGTLAGKRIAANWRSPDGKKTLPFMAEQTSEIRIGSKKDILAAAVGEYALESIEGSGGASAMWGTWKAEGRWQSNMSSTSGGTRQGDMIELDRADIRLLDSLKIRVRPDLSTQLLVKGKTVLEIPYLASGMEFRVKPPADPIGKDQLEKLSPATTVLDETLYLFAHDKVDLSNAISGHFEATLSDILIVSYSIVDGSFELAFLPDQCCGGTTLRFTRGGKRPAP